MHRCHHCTVWHILVKLYCHDQIKERLLKYVNLLTLLVTSGIRIFIDTYSKESNFYRLYSKVLLSGENSLNISHIWMFNWFIHLWMSCKLTTERITSLLYCHYSDLHIQNTKSTSNILSRVKINKWWILLHRLSNTSTFRLQTNHNQQYIKIQYFIF